MLYKCGYDPHIWVWDVRTFKLAARIKTDLSSFCGPDLHLSPCRRGRHRRDGSRMGPVNGKDRKSTRLNSSHSQISYAVFCLKKKKKKNINSHTHNQSRDKHNPLI